MSNSNHAFCKSILADMMIEAKKVFTKEEIDGCWNWKPSNVKGFEFHGIKNEKGSFYLYNQACCKYHIQYLGFEKMIEARKEGLI